MVAGKSQGYSAHYCWDNRRTRSYLAFYIGEGDLNPGVNTFTARAEPTEPSPQLQLCPISSTFLNTLTSTFL